MPIQNTTACALSFNVVISPGALRDSMKRIACIVLFMAVNLYACAVAQPPKYKLAVSKQTKTLPPYEWCSLTFTFTNTRNSRDSLWMEAIVLDAENNTITDTFLTFPSLVNFATPVRKAQQQEVIIFRTCNRIRQVAITGNGQMVEPDSFAWDE